MCQCARRNHPPPFDKLRASNIRFSDSALRVHFYNKYGENKLYGHIRFDSCVAKCCLNFRAKCFGQSGFRPSSARSVGVFREPCSFSYCFGCRVSDTLRIAVYYDVHTMVTVHDWNLRLRSCRLATIEVFVEIYFFFSTMVHWKRERQKSDLHGNMYSSRRGSRIFGRRLSGGKNDSETRASETRPGGEERT